jgi:cystathionine beta-synthase
VTDIDITNRAHYARTAGIEHDLAASRRLVTDARGREIAPDILSLLGDTPMVRLDRFARDVGPTIVAKLEMLNPGGSVKDRIGIAMIEAMEAAGTLPAGGTIVEPTSGNTGVGLAMAAALKGYRCIFVCPDKVAQDKIQLLRAYGAEVVVCPTAVEPDDPRSYYSVSDELASRPNHVKPNQYFNQSNPQAHMFSTGPEIWRQTKGEIDAFVCGVGTGGTATGIGRYLKERKPGVQIIGADPVGSIYSGDVHTYLVEGVGEDFYPPTFQQDIIDHWYRISDADSFAAARTLVRDEGILVGGSCGMALHAAMLYAEGRPEDELIVVLLPDSGRGYLSKMYDDAWMSEHGFLERRGRYSVGEGLRAKGTQMPDLVHVHPSETVAAAIAVLKEFGVSQLPVFAEDVHEAARLSDIIGSVRENALLDAALKDPSIMQQPVGAVMSESLPVVAAGDALGDASRLLAAGNQAVIVVDGDRPVGVLSGADLLSFLAEVE